METTTTRRNVSAVTDIRIGRIIQDEREARRFTLDELATAIDCKHPTLKNYESGKRTIPSDRAAKLAEVFRQHPVPSRRPLDPRTIDPDAA